MRNEALGVHILQNTWNAGQGIPGRQTLYYSTAVRLKIKVLTFSLFVLMQAAC